MVQTLRESMRSVWQEVRNLGIVVPRAINPEDLPLTPASGEIVGITEVWMDYQGPYHALGLGWGLIPAGAADFNNGDNLIPDAWTWGVLPAIGQRATWASLRWTRTHLGAGFGRMVIPYAGEYLARGGALRTLNVGTADTWIWVFDITAMMADGLMAEDDSVVLEEYFLEIDTDADVVELQEPPYVPPVIPAADVRDLEVRYEFA